MNIHAYLINTDNSVVMARRGVAVEVEVGKGEENWDICNSVNNRKKTQTFLFTSVVV